MFLFTFYKGNSIKYFDSARSDIYIIAHILCLGMRGSRRGEGVRFPWTYQIYIVKLPKICPRPLLGKLKYSSTPPLPGCLGTYNTNLRTRYM